MFSLFQKKIPPKVTVKEYDSPWFVAGCQTTTSLKTIKKDVPALQKEFQAVRDQLQDLAYPLGTVVICGKPDTSGKFSYFLGDLVEHPDQTDDIDVFRLEPGKYAVVTVDFNDPTRLTLETAKAKSYFFNKWLPSSGYETTGTIDSMELYDRRSNIKLASMDLIFPIREK